MGDTSQDSDLIQHLQTFSSALVYSSKTLLNDRRPTQINLRYSLVSRMDWIDITVENKIPPFMDVHLLQPREMVFFSEFQHKHTLLKGPVWEGEDLFVSMMNMSSEQRVRRIQLDLDLTYYMGPSLEWDKVLPLALGYSQHHRKWRHFWTGTLSFGGQKSTFLLSLSGRVNRVSLKSMQEGQNLSIHIFWFATFNRNFKKLTDVRPLRYTLRGESRQKLITNQGFIFDWSKEPSFARFHNFSAAPYAFISYKQHNILNTVDEPKDYSKIRGTWTEAMQLCETFDGYLPILKSREQLDHLLSLFKLPFQTPPPMPVMFIGLIKSKVKFW